MRGRDAAAPARRASWPRRTRRSAAGRAAPQPSARRSGPRTPRRRWPSPRRAGRTPSFWTSACGPTTSRAAPRTGRPTASHLPDRGGGPARIARRCAFIGVRGRGLVHFRPARLGDVADLSHVCSTERVMSDGVHGPLALRRRSRVKRGRPRHVASKSPSAACGTTLTSIASIASVAAGDRMRQLRCEAALKAQKLAAVVSSDDAPCPIVRLLWIKYDIIWRRPGAARDGPRRVGPRGGTRPRSGRRPSPPTNRRGVGAGQRSCRRIKRTCFYDLAASARRPQIVLERHTINSTAALAPRGDARAAQVVGVGAGGRARRGSGGREAAAARAASSDDVRASLFCPSVCRCEAQRVPPPPRSPRAHRPALGRKGWLSFLVRF